MRDRVALLLTVAAVAACNADNSNGPFTGTLKGQLTSSLGGGLANIPVLVSLPTAAPTDTTVHTNSNGAFQINNVPIGSGSVQVESLPPDCDTLPAEGYFIESPGTTATLNFTVACKSTHQLVGGGDFDGGAIDDEHRRGLAGRDDPGGVTVAQRIAPRSHAPGRVTDVILDGRAVALSRESPMALRHERFL